MALCLLASLTRAGDKPGAIQRLSEPGPVQQNLSQNESTRFGPELALCSKGVRLSWHSESGIREVILERSRNGKDFETLFRMETTEKGHATEFLETDFQPLSGMSYYRIRERYQDGRTTVSSASAILMREGEMQLQAGTMITTDAKLPEDRIVVLVQDGSGESLCAALYLTEETEAGLIDPDHTLPAGDYTIIACSRQKFYSAKLRVN